MEGRSLDRQTGRAILDRAAELSRLLPQVSTTSAPGLEDDLFAYVIRPQGRQLTVAEPELVEVAAGQVARELIAEVIRRVQAQQQSVPGQWQQEIEVPYTGQPFATDRPDVRGMRLVGDPHGLRISLGGVEVDDVSRETQAVCDNGSVYNAFVAGGAVVRLRVRTRIEIVSPNLIGVLAVEHP
jgi:hypothetical protein